MKGAFSTAELMMAEAVGLVSTLDGWRVVDKIILSTKVPEKKRIFGKGNFQSLTGIRVKYLIEIYCFFNLCLGTFFMDMCR